MILLPSNETQRQETDRTECLSKAEVCGHVVSNVEYRSGFVISPVVHNIQGFTGPLWRMFSADQWRKLAQQAVLSCLVAIAKAAVTIPPSKQYETYLQTAPAEED